MVATKRRETNWDKLKEMVHVCGPDAELRIPLKHIGPDADGPGEPTVVVIKCRAGFIRAGNFLFAWPDLPSGGKPGHLQPNVWELTPTGKEGELEARILTEGDLVGEKPDVPEEVLQALEQAGFHWEEWAARV